MFKIINDGKTLALVEKPKWVKLQKNGCFALCSQKDASGIAIDGEVYHIVGRDELPGKQDVSVVEVDGGGIVSSLADDLVSAQQDITDRELEAIDLGQQVTDLELMVLEGVK